MLAYRHAFHAGNHADVLKHITLCLVLRYMNQKDKSYRLIDTHAGAGGYSLEGQYAQKKGEYLQGVARLWDRDDLPPAVADYMALVRQFNPDGRLEQYPGSPAFAQMMLRAQDQLRLYELHPTDHRILEAFLGKVKGAEVKDTDGFDGLKSQVPPSSRRAVVLRAISNDEIGDFDDDDVRDLSQWLPAFTVYVNGVEVKVIEEDDISANDVGTRTIGVLPIGALAVGDLAPGVRVERVNPDTSARVIATIDVDDGTYEFRCTLARWHEQA